MVVLSVYYMYSIVVLFAPSLRRTVNHIFSLQNYCRAVEQAMKTCFFLDPILQCTVLHLLCPYRQPRTNHHLEYRVNSSLWWTSRCLCFVHVHVHVLVLCPPARFVIKWLQCLCRRELDPTVHGCVIFDCGRCRVCLDEYQVIEQMID